MQNPDWHWGLIISFSKGVFHFATEIISCVFWNLSHVSDYINSVLKQLHSHCHPQHTHRHSLLEIHYVMCQPETFWIFHSKNIKTLKIGFLHFSNRITLFLTNGQMNIFYGRISLCRNLWANSHNAMTIDAPISLLLHVVQTAYLPSR